MMFSGFGGFETWRAQTEDHDAYMRRMQAQIGISALDARKAAMLRREAGICRMRGDDEAAAACNAGADHFDPSGQVPPA